MARVCLCVCFEIMRNTCDAWNVLLYQKCAAGKTTCDGQINTPPTAVEE